MTPEQLEVRRRLKDSFSFYSEKALKIRTKDGQIVPLVLNRAQRRLLEVVERQLRTKGYVRIVVLKGRQQGLSTEIQGLIYWAVSQRKGAKALILAHKAESSDTLFQMTRRYHQNVPEILQPHTKYSSRRELIFDVLDSSYMVATAGGEGTGRSETITHLHASELAFWKASTADETWNGIEQTIADAEGTMIFAESTANGIGNTFYNLWEGAVEGTNGYEAVFIPWYWQEEYRSDVPDKFQHTPEEEKLVELYGLDDAQLQWRRRKIAVSGRDLFSQEYPCTPEEAFLASGRPVFNPDKINDRLKEVRAAPPPKRLALEGDEWVEHPRGELAVYKEPEAGKSYCVGADTASGVRGNSNADERVGRKDTDWSVAQVLDDQKEQVAVWRGKVDPEYFAKILYELGTYYNFPLIAVENDKNGVLTNHILAKELSYPWVYQDQLHDQVNDRYTIKLGWTPTAKTKPMVINELRADLRTDSVILNDEPTLREMLTFVETESGKMEAEEGCHDDCVMSLCISNHVHEGVHTSAIENQDDWYYEID